MIELKAHRRESPTRWTGASPRRALLIALCSLLAAQCGGDAPPGQDLGGASDLVEDTGGGDTVADSVEDLDVAPDPTVDPDLGVEEPDSPDLCTPGTLGCGCDDSDECEDGLRCNEDDGICEECPPGEEGCACDEDEEGAPLCDEGLRCEEDDELCEECPPGEEGCVCDDDEDGEPTVCEEPWTCDDEEVICVCLAGTEACPCGEDDEGGLTVCGDELICSEGICVTPECGTPGTIFCPCDGDGECDEGLYCDDYLTCRPCSTDILGCPCEDGTCDGVNVCDEDTSLCRVPLSCDELACLEHQLCQAAEAGADAICLEECDADYGWDDYTGSCVAVPSCNPDAPLSVLATCTAELRDCVTIDELGQCGDCFEGYAEDDYGDCAPANCTTMDCVGRAHRYCEMDGDSPLCTDCISGWIEDGYGECIDRVTCDELEEPCPSHEPCNEATADADAHCAPCGAGYVNSGGTCARCTHCYQFPEGEPIARDGVTGNLSESFSTGITSLCVCTLDDGYFQRVSDGQVQLCDEDLDGWITATWLPLRALAGGDNPLYENHGCDVRSIDRFELRSDDAPASPYHEVTIGQIASAYDFSEEVPEDLSGTAYVELIEPNPLDVVSRFDRRYEPGSSIRLREYGGATGLQFTAAEVNPLTKSCNDPRDDLNMDDYSDVEQAQEAPYNPASGDSDIDGMEVFYHMAYYIETTRGFYREPGDGEDYGTYVLVEKSRRLGPDDSLGLEMTYADDEGTYWQECIRARPADYPGPTDSDEVTPDLPLNFEFARWSACDAPGDPVTPGTCRHEADRHRMGSYFPYDGRTPSTNAARLDVSADGDWPGMNHPSQFRCMVLDDAASDETFASMPIDSIRNDDDRTGAPYALLDCQLDEDEYGERLVDPPLGALEANPADPVMSCTAVEDPIDIGVMKGRSDTNGQHYWVATRYIDYARDADTEEYRRGCISEAQEWPFVCEGYDPMPYLDSSAPSANIGNFGRLICGCGFNNGGPACDLGCPTDSRAERLHFGGTYESPPGADYGCDNGYCLKHPPVPEEEFDGGRRGWWMCGDFGATTYTETEAAPQASACGACIPCDPAAPGGDQCCTPNVYEDLVLVEEGVPCGAGNQCCWGVGGDVLRYPLGELPMTGLQIVGDDEYTWSVR